MKGLPAGIRRTGQQREGNEILMPARHPLTTMPERNGARIRLVPELQKKKKRYGEKKFI